MCKDAYIISEFGISPSSDYKIRVEELTSKFAYQAYCFSLFLFILTTSILQEAVKVKEKDKLTRQLVNLLTRQLLKRKFGLIPN